MTLQTQVLTAASHLPRMAALALLTWSAAFLAPPADAGCLVPPGPDAPGAARLPPGAEVARALHDGGAASHSGKAVGLWHALFVTSGGQKYDETFQAIHSDGTEMMISNGLPPFLGNVCVGVWKKVSGAIKLRHVTWNWNPDNSFAGTFVMLVTFKIDRHGNSYSGTWSAKNFDPDGNPIPELDAEGEVTATRVSVG